MAQLNGMRALQRDLERKVRTVDRDVQNVVRRHGVQMNRKMTRNASFSGDYTTGATRRSIHLRLTNRGFTATVSPSTDYASYPEYGTRYMYPQPYARPAFWSEVPLFMESMDKLAR
ncbi:HK97-gp10 family putative phage morphogenesis protein [Salicibibacter kimchii]|uniref:HK97 gp10 family phage protein n=1 Tax=Salicibibacter kimchii TaxID=2099786 RepID=A0A345BUJ2_9BACI|nr:HK97-gp10 family putative phage morphogenesis protein [Salicibibacter kimchii]AXF54623.1 hypothetical protein DT065_00400 [Salicibibacter kimchii]